MGMLNMLVSLVVSIVILVFVLKFYYERKKLSPVMAHRKRYEKYTEKFYTLKALLKDTYGNNKVSKMEQASSLEFHISEIAPLWLKFNEKEPKSLAELPLLPELLEGLETGSIGTVKHTKQEDSSIHEDEDNQERSQHMTGKPTQGEIKPDNYNAETKTNYGESGPVVRVPSVSSNLSLLGLGKWDIENEQEVAASVTSETLSSDVDKKSDFREDLDFVRQKEIIESKSSSLREEVEVDNVNENEKSTSSVVFNSGTVNDKLVDVHNSEIYKTFVAPYKDYFVQQGAYDLVMKIVNLLEKQGNCPSVVLKDQEGQNLSSGVVDNLAKVSLKQHTINVARFILDELKNIYQTPEIHIPKSVVAALAHDLGKIPAFHTGDYNTIEHPFISEMKLTELAGSENIIWLNVVRTAIREHHLPATKEQFTNILKSADRKARLIELLSYVKDFRISEFSNWFDVRAFLEKLVRHVNVSQTNKWQALSYKGIIYCRLTLVYNVANELRKEKKVFDPLFIYKEEELNVVKSVISELKKKDITAGLPINVYYQRYKIFTPVTKKLGKAGSILLVPLRMEAVCNITGVSIAEIEDRKKGKTLGVLSVEPAQNTSLS